MMSQDNRLLPVTAIDRPLDRPLSDITQSKGYGYGYGAAAMEPTNIRDYLHVVLKRKWLILSLVVVITTLVTIQMFRQPSIYEGVATIKIEPKPRSVLQTKDVVINSGTDPNFWGTQLKSLESQALARQVVLTLDLQHNPEFFGGQQAGIFSTLRKAFSREKESKTPPPAEPAIVGEADLKGQSLSEEEKAKLEPYEDAIIANESVEPVTGTNFVTIKYRHTNPELSQKIANTMAEVFVNNNLERTTAGTNKAEELLLNEIAKQQMKIKHEQEAQINYARDKGIALSKDDPTSAVDAQNLGLIATQLLSTVNERKNLQAAYESAKQAPDKFTIPEVMASERIAKLRDKISQLKQRREALRTKYTDEWWEVKEIDNQLKPLEAELERAPDEVIASMKAKYDAAVKREHMLQQSYNQQKGTTSQQTLYQIEMTAKSQELEQDKQYLSTLEQRERDLRATINGDRPNEVSFDTPSRLPRAPIGPARFRNIAIAFVISLLAGIGLAFLLDFLDDTVKSIEDVDRYIHLPALALIPASRDNRLRLRGSVPSPAQPGSETALAMIDDVRSPIAESYRHLRTSLLLSSAGQPPKTILITSSQPSEGKTTTAINTAVMLAQTGAEVLTIDCDLRRPRLHANFEVPNTGGLTNLLSGESDLDRYLQSYARLPNLKLLTSGPVPPNPAELLGSDEMRKLLAQLSTRFAHIIVDSPPAISFTDASILSTMVDGVVLVVHGGRSSRAVVRRARQQLVDVGAHIFGIVLNNVKLETQDYYYAGYYSSHYYRDDSPREEEVAASASQSS